MKWDQFLNLEGLEIDLGDSTVGNLIGVAGL